jgi:hypothetical protein
MEKGETDLTDCAAAQCMHNLALLCVVINHSEVMCAQKACVIYYEQIMPLLSVNCQLVAAVEMCDPE